MMATTGKVWHLAAPLASLNTASIRVIALHCFTLNSLLQPCPRLCECLSEGGFLLCPEQDSMRTPQLTSSHTAKTMADAGKRGTLRPGSGRDA